MNCPWIEVWGLPAACLLYSVFLNNKTGYIRFYIIVSVFPRTNMLIYLHTSPDFRSGYIIHWLFADCLCNICNCLCLVALYINFHFSIFVVISIEIVHSLHHWLELLVIAFMILLHSLLIKFSELFKVILIILSLFLISHETNEESQNISFKSSINVMLYTCDIFAGSMQGCTMAMLKLYPCIHVIVICKGCYQDETIPGRAAVGGHWNMNHET